MLFSTTDYLFFILAILTLFPLRVQISLFLKTGLYDYLIFAGVYFPFMLTLLLYVVNGKLQLLFLWQLRHALLNLTFFMFFIHAIRLNSLKLNNLLSYVGITWFAILEISILFWKFLEISRGQVLFFEMDPHPINPEPIAGISAGLQINDIIVYSSSMPILAVSFYIFSLLTVTVSYITVDVARPITSIKTAQRLWITSSVIAIIASFNVIFKFLKPADIMTTLLVLIMFILIAFISMKFPESMLLSHVQIYRALQFYDKVTERPKDFEEETHSMERVRAYIDGLSVDVVDKAKDVHGAEATKTP